MTTAPNLESWVAPGNWRDDEAGSGDLARWINEVLQPTLNLLVDEATRWEKQVDPDTADEPSVDSMLQDLGNPFEVATALSLARRRRLVRSLVEAYKVNGTVEGLRAIVRALTGIEITGVIAPAQVTFWRLGFHTLNGAGDPHPPPVTDRAVLGPGPRYLAYSFQVEVGVVLTDEQREVITQIARAVKPAHTHFLGIVEPGTIPEPDHWSLGQSLLGSETTLH